MISSVISKCVAVIFLCCTTLVLCAQSTYETMDYNEVLWSAQKREVIQQAMGLSEYEASSFWPVYEWYERSRRRISAKYSGLMEEYAESSEEMTNKESHEFAKRLYECDKEFDILYKNYYMQIRKVVGSSRALKFMQIEMHIQNQKQQVNNPFVSQMNTVVSKNE